MKEPCYFGIDGGGTHSRLALVNAAGDIIAKSKTGSTNIYSATPEQVKENISLLLEKALASASISKSDLCGGCMGSAGLGRTGEKKLLREFFDYILGPEFPVYLCGDGEILLVGGLGGLEGYCLIAGTGSIALGRSKDGCLIRAGGHGYLLGDEGSAAWIGRTAIARILRSIEGRDLKSAMLPLLLEAANLKESSDLIRYVHHEADKAAVAALAPAVTAAARQGDTLALDILYTGAAELVLLVKSVLEQSPWINVNELVLAGGVIEHDDILTGKLKELLAFNFPNLMVRKPERSALEGAVMLAQVMINTKT